MGRDRHFYTSQRSSQKIAEDKREEKQTGRAQDPHDLEVAVHSLETREVLENGVLVAVAWVNKWNRTITSNEIHVIKTSLTGFWSIHLNVGSQNLQNESRK